VPTLFYPLYLSDIPTAGWNFNSLLLRDSELFQGVLYLLGPSSNVTSTATFVNNLFENVYCQLSGRLKVNAYNNLFHLS
jgi:hypothetical protein